MAAPVSPSAGQLINKTFWDAEIYDRWAAQYAAWTAYTPVWAASSSNPAIGNGTLDGKYFVADASAKTMDVVIRVIAGSTTTFGSGSYEFGLPSGWNLNITTCVGYGFVFDTSATAYYPAVSGVVAGNNNRVRLRTHLAGNMSGTTPVTLANGDIIAICVRTEFA